MMTPLHLVLDALRPHRGGVAAGLTLTLCCTMLPLSNAAPPSAAGISTITLERNGFGESAGSLLVLRRDGQVTFTETGNARHGTEDKLSRGTLRTQDFDAVAKLAVAQGFFSLNDEYQLPDIQDGRWSTLAMTRDGVEKRVFRREDAGPAALGAIESAIDELKARVALRPSKP